MAKPFLGLRFKGEVDLADTRPNAKGAEIDPGYRRFSDSEWASEASVRARARGEARPGRIARVEVSKDYLNE